MRKVKQSTTKNILVWMTDSSNRAVFKSGLTLVITASKDGAAFAAITPAVTDRGNGSYNLALTASHTDTLGDLWLYITATGADPNAVPLEVVAYNPLAVADLGLSYLNVAVGSRAAPGDAMTLTGAYDAAKTAAPESGGNVAAIKAKTDIIGASVALETGGNLAGVKTKTDLIGASVALETGGNLASVKAKTDNLPASPADEAAVDEVRRLLKNKLTINKTTSVLELWNDAGDTILMTWPLTDKDGNTIVLTGTGPANRGVPS